MTQIHMRRSQNLSSFQKHDNIGIFYKSLSDLIFGMNISKHKTRNNFYSVMLKYEPDNPKQLFWIRSHPKGMKEMEVSFRKR